MDIQENMLEEVQTIKRAAALTGIGARLKAAREKAHLTEKDAANRLHLSPKFIFIIENEDFENGPPATFMRGYIRSYARMLNFPEIEVSAMLDQLNMNAAPTPAPTLKLHSQPLVNNSDRYLRWMSYVIVVLLITLVGIWWASHTPETMTADGLNKNTVQPAAPVAAPATTPPPAPAAPQPATNIISAQPAAAPAVNQPSAVTPAPNSTTATLQQPTPAAPSVPPTEAQAPVAQAQPTPPVPQPSVVQPVAGATATQQQTIMPPLAAPATTQPQAAPPHKKHRRSGPAMQMAEPGLGF